MIALPHLHAVAALAMLAASPAAARAQGALQPYQMVRSLEIVQDRIAGGDHAIMPMQRQLLSIIDGRLRTGKAEDFADDRNLQALLVYAMSGGNPSTVDLVLSRLGLDGRNGEIGKGVLHYLNGRTTEAQAALQPVDPLALPPALGAFVALIKGSVVATDAPQEALKLLDEARLLAPGTLVEEGALRRSIGLAATVGDAERFMRASTQYAQRYLRSPYASQFADAFVAGVVSLHGSFDTAGIGTITAMMDAEQERVIYLRIARRAGIDGLKDLASYASEKAEEAGRRENVAEDPRALLYSSLASVTSGTSDEIGAKLAKIDRGKLSPSDRELYDAVAAVAIKLTATPPSLPAPAIDVEAEASDDMAAAEEEYPPLVEVEAAPPAAPRPNMVSVPTAPSQVRASAGSAKPEPADEKVAETRRKLDEIDKLLGDVQ